MERTSNILWFLAFGIASSAWCASSWKHLGPTFDETLYVVYGLEHWRTGSPNPGIHAGVMPVPLDVQTLPIYLWEQKRGRPFDAFGALGDILPVARAGNLVFWWLLLFVAFRWGALYGGTWGGRAAVAFVATEPNLLGHAALATTDIAATATILATVFVYERERGSNWTRRVVWPGMLYGVALATKASALPYVPLMCAVLELPRLIGSFRQQPGSWVGRILRGSSRFRWDAVAILITGLAAACAITGSDWRAEPHFLAWANSLEPGPMHDIFVWLAGTGFACFPNALEGIARQIKHGMNGHHGAVIFGRFVPDSVWYYYPATMIVKLTDSTLLLIPLGLAFNRRLWRSPLVRLAFALVLFSLTTKVQIGIRLVFPLVVVLHIGLGVALVTCPRKKLALALGILAIGYSAALSWLAWPDGIRFTNQTWGGPERGSEFLADSNYDWGQGLPELKSWWRTHGEPELFIWFSGSDPQQLLPPFHRLGINEWPNPAISHIRDRVGSGYLAVSSTLLLACPDRRPETLAVVAWLKSLAPVDRTRTMLIYRLGE